MCDLETIIVPVLPTFSFIAHRSHHTLTLFRSRFIDSVTATLSAVQGDKAAHLFIHTINANHYQYYSAHFTVFRLYINYVHFKDSDIGIVYTNT